MRPGPYLAYFGHHKCASTWIEQVCASVCHDLMLRFRIFYDARDFDDDLMGALATEETDFFAYANADFRHVNEIDSVLGFHVVRDPRDIVVSAYFSHLHSHSTSEWPELSAHRERLKAVSKEEGIMLEMDFRAGQFDEMMSWPDAAPANVLRLKFEELSARPYEKFLEIFGFLGILDQNEPTASSRVRFVLAKVGAKLRAKTGVRLTPLAIPRIPAERILGIAWENRFSRKAGGREKGTEDVTSHYRKGVAGDWLNHFTPEHVEYFNRRYFSLLFKYGYEADTNWTQRYVSSIVGHP